MGILSRIMTVFKSNVNDLINKAEDPKKMLDQIIRDMSKQLEQAKEEVAVAIADEKNLNKKYTEAQKNAEAWEHKAMLAVNQNNDSLAMEALKKQEESKQIAQSYENQWKIQVESVNKLKNSLRDLHKKLEEASRKKNLLIARQKRAEAQDKISKTMRSLNDSSAFDSFARMEEKIETMEASSEAKLEIESDLAGKSLDNDFQKLEMNQNIQDKLLELKKKAQNNQNK